MKNPVKYEPVLMAYAYCNLDTVRVNTFGNNFAIVKKEFSFIVIATDLLVIFIFLFFISHIDAKQRIYA